MSWTIEEVNAENLKLINELAQAHKLIKHLNDNYNKLYEEYLKVRDIRKEVNQQTGYIREQVNCMKKEEEFHSKNLKLMEEISIQMLKFTRDIAENFNHFVRKYLDR